MQLTGLGTPLFKTCMDNLHLIHTTFSHHVPEHTLEPFQPLEFLSHPCNDVSTYPHVTLHPDVKTQLEQPLLSLIPSIPSLRAYCSCCQLIIIFMRKITKSSIILSFLLANTNHLDFYILYLLYFSLIYNLIIIVDSL